MRQRCRRVYQQHITKLECRDCLQLRLGADQAPICTRLARLQCQDWRKDRHRLRRSEALILVKSIEISVLAQPNRAYSAAQ